MSSQGRRVKTHLRRRNVAARTSPSRALRNRAPPITPRMEVSWRVAPDLAAAGRGAPLPGVQRRSRAISLGVARLIGMVKPREGEGRGTPCPQPRTPCGRACACVQSTRPLPRAAWAGSPVSAGTARRRPCKHLKPRRWAFHGVVLGVLAEGVGRRAAASVVGAPLTSNRALHARSRRNRQHPPRRSAQGCRPPRLAQAALAEGACEQDVWRPRAP